MTRFFNSEIFVAENDIWYYKNSEIINTNVLNFFKTNLEENEKGIYIKNKFHDFDEVGYISCQGFPLKIKHIDFQNLLYVTDSAEKISMEDVIIYLSGENLLFVMKKEGKFIKYRFSRSSLQELQPFLFEKENIFYLQKENFYQEFTNFQGEIGVPLPY